MPAETSAPSPVRRPTSSAATVALACVLLAVAPTAPPATAAAPPARAETVLADPVYLSHVDRGLALVYDLRLAEAEALFRQLSRERPGHPVGPLLEMLPDWWRILLDSRDTSRDAAMERALDESLARAELRLERDPDDHEGLFFKATALAFQARLGALRGEWLSAANKGRAALKILRRLDERWPGNADLGFGLGLYDYFADVLPERHAIFRPLTPFFPAGDREAGLAKLRKAVDEGRFARSEAAYFMLQIYYHFEGDAEGSRSLVTELRRRHPGNALFHLYEARVAARWGRCDDAVRSLDEMMQRHAGSATGYNDAIASTGLWLYGRCELQRGRYGAALVRLRKLESLLHRRPPSNLGVLAALGRGMAYDALGRRPEAVEQYQRVLTMDDAGQAHDRAEEFLRQPYRSGVAGDDLVTAASGP